MEINNYISMQKKHLLALIKELRNNTMESLVKSYKRDIKYTYRSIHFYRNLRNLGVKEI